MYGRDYYGGYDRGYGNSPGIGFPRGLGFAGYPGSWGWGPVMPLGFGGWGAYVPMGGYYGADVGFPRPRREPPRESPTYGRGGDRALQRWSRRHGYDAGYRIAPRLPPRRGYDRG